MFYTSIERGNIPFLNVITLETRMRNVVRSVIIIQYVYKLYMAQEHFGMIILITLRYNYSFYCEGVVTPLATCNSFLISHAVIMSASARL